MYLLLQWTSLASQHFTPYIHAAHYPYIVQVLWFVSLDLLLKWIRTRILFLILFSFDYYTCSKYMNKHPNSGILTAWEGSSKGPIYASAKTNHTIYLNLIWSFIGQNINYAFSFCSHASFPDLVCILNNHVICKSPFNMFLSSYQ